MLNWKAARATVTIALLASLAGCTAPGPKFSGLKEVPKASAELIVYRKSAFFASGSAMSVFVNGGQVGELYNASYLQQQLPPGEYSIKVTPGPLAQSAERSIKLAAGERRFLHFDFPTGPLANVFFIGVTLEERDEMTALDDLKELSSAKLASNGKL